MGEDRFSALPDVLIHHILSFLDMTEVISTSLLSSKWRYVWRSTHVLNFSLREWMRQGGCFDTRSKLFRERRRSFMDFVHTVLLVGGISYIEKFNLHDNDIDNISRTYPLFMKSPAFFDNVFTSNLRDLKLDICKSLVRLPISLCTSARIENLELCDPLFPEGNESGELVLSCPLLKNLKIGHCDLTHLKLLRISTPLLEKLLLSNLFVEKESFCKVKINTPNLKSFMVFSWLTFSNFPVAYSVEDLCSVIDADINFDMPDDIHMPDDYYKRCCEGLLEILSKVYKAQTLRLLFRSIEMLVDIPELFQQLPDLYPNLKTLMLVSPPLKALHSHADFKILKRLPCLENFLLQNGWASFSTYKKENWVLIEPVQSIFSCLKTFEIQNFQGLEGELKFLEFILERATCLEKMSIKSKEGISDEKIRGVEKRLLSIPQASASCSILFCKRRKKTKVHA